jgi:hypothetical protein
MLFMALIYKENIRLFKVSSSENHQTAYLILHVSLFHEQKHNIIHHLQFTVLFFTVPLHCDA